MPAYDRSFRRLMEQLFPDNSLKRIPPNHEIFSNKIGGYDLKILAWLAGWEPQVCAVVAGLITRARSHAEAVRR